MAPKLSPYFSRKKSQRTASAFLQFFSIFEFNLPILKNKLHIVLFICVQTGLNLKKFFIVMLSHAHQQGG